MTADKHVEEPQIVTEKAIYQAQPDPFEGLPPADTKRWVVSRKAQVVRAVEDAVITLDQACDRYSLSPEEFEHWRELIKSHGTRALRATRVQDYRRASRKARVMR